MTLFGSLNAMSGRAFSFSVSFVCGLFFSPDLVRFVFQGIVNTIEFSSIICILKHDYVCERNFIINPILQEHWQV